jgi:hypothetical protein
MAISFNQHKGSAIKKSLNTFQFKNGDNSMRICGDILARYVYWVKGENDKNIPLECLSFDRNAEAFTNIEKDWIREYYPDLKCAWSYATQCIDNGEVKVVNLKKKLWEAIISAAEDLGDPTDPVTGWDIKFKRVKTGPLPYNVEYQLQALKCKPSPMSEEDSALAATLKSMDEVMPRPTPDAQKELLDRVRQATTTEVDDTLEAEFNVG